MYHLSSVVTLVPKVLQKWSPCLATNPRAKVRIPARLLDVQLTQLFIFLTRLVDIWAPEETLGKWPVVTRISYLSPVPWLTGSYPLQIHGQMRWSSEVTSRCWMCPQLYLSSPLLNVHACDRCQSENTKCLSLELIAKKQISQAVNNAYELFFHQPSLPPRPLTTVNSF